MDREAADRDYRNTVEAALERLDRNSVERQIPVFVTVPRPLVEDDDLARACAQESV